MSSSPGSGIVLRGEVVTDHTAELRQRIQVLETALREERHARKMTEEEMKIVARAVTALRKRLKPQYDELRAIFGELDALPHADGPASPDAPAQGNYDAIKRNFSPSCGQVIDALIIQPLTLTQAAAFCKMHYDTAKKALTQLKAAGVVEKEGKLFRLRRLG